jgi:hypothetical protein
MRKIQLYKFPLDNFHLQYRSNKIQNNGNSEEIHIFNSKFELIQNLN